MAAPDQQPMSQAGATAAAAPSQAVTDDEPVGLVEDDPERSSAALCIEFQLLGERFRPVYTHQVFPGEWIRGYRPPRDRLGELDNNGALPHSSFRNHSKASWELLTTVQLAPSCERCRIDVVTQRGRAARSPPPRRSSKRTRRETSPHADGGDSEGSPINDEDEDEDGNDELVEDDDEEYEESGDEDSGKEEASFPGDKEGSTRRGRMPLEEVRQSIEEGVPATTTTTTSDGDLDNCYLRAPIGTVVEEYERRGMEFVLTLANGPDAVSFHTQVQRLAVWYIETASDVDVADDSNGYWTVLYLFRKHAPSQFSFAGYMTLFHFRSPFRKPEPGVVLRVAQALLLPPYQRMGHGRTMLHAVFDHAAAHNATNGDDKRMGLSKTVEINVEDPAPAFVQLRNRVDLERFMSSGVDAEDNWLGAFWTCTVENEKTFFTALPEDIITEATSKARVTRQQVQTVYELRRLQQLTEVLCEPGRGSDRDALERRYRLLVKARLNKLHAEELGGCRNKEEKQKLLAELFDERLQQYQAILSSVHKSDLSVPSRSTTGNSC